jgi:hypothetical protein
MVTSRQDLAIIVPLAVPTGGDSTIYAASHEIPVAPASATENSDALAAQSMLTEVRPGPAGYAAFR